MSDIRLFHIADGHASSVTTVPMALEKQLQSLVEANLEALLNVRFLASEYSTGPIHGGRIDSLGLDENDSPVIIEYKRHSSENVINQGLFYLDWLMDHRAEFQLLVQNALGPEAAKSIDWTGPRLLCIAADFTRYDEHAVKQMNRNIELLRYRTYDHDLLLLELVNAVAAGPTSGKSAGTAPGTTYKTVDQVIADNAGTPMGDLYEELRSRILALGDDIQEKQLMYYVAFKRLSNFACVEVQKRQMHVYLKVDPKSVDLEDGFTRDVRSIGHYGTGDLEVTIADADSLNRAWPLVEESYQRA